MAFVFQDQRKPQLAKDLNLEVGPGTYETILPKNLNNNVAPFNSTQHKSKLNQPQTPGVGDYEIQTFMIPPKAKSYKCKNQLIIKMSRSQGSNFRSTSPRFRKEFSETTPGVGNYNISKDITQKTFQIPIKSNKMLRSNTFNSNNSPDQNPYKQIQAFMLQKRNRIASIPQKRKVITENPQSSYSLQQSQFSTSSNQINIGPGQYEIKNQFEVNKQKTSLWSKSKTKRLVPENTQMAEIGPGKYKLQEQFNSNKGKPQSSYMSSTTKSTWDKIYFKSNKDTVAMDKMKNFQKVVSQGYDEPGPNTYKVERVVRAINSEENRGDFQFFGSSEQRFKKQKIQFNISPGQYNLPQENFLRHRSLSPPFNSTQERVDIHFQKVMNFNPGPGNYDETYQSLQKTIQSKKENGYIGKFGCTDPRFKIKNQDTIFQPGPGKYEAKQTWVKDSDKIQNAGFKSQSPRDLFRSPDFDIPTAQKYKVKNFQISTKLEQQKLNIDKLRKLSVKQAPFNSRELRFKHEKGQKQEFLEDQEGNNFYNKQQYTTNIPQAPSTKQIQLQNIQQNEFLANPVDPISPNQNSQKNFQWQNINQQVIEESESQDIDNINISNNDVKSNSGMDIMNQLNGFQKSSSGQQSPMDNNNYQLSDSGYNNNQNKQQVKNLKSLLQSKQKNRLLPHNRPKQQPFLFNAKKLDQIYKDIPDTVGPGHYEAKKKDWVKKSFNRQFKPKEIEEESLQNEQYTQISYQNPIKIN